MNGNESVIDAFLKRVGGIINLVGVLMIVFWGIHVTVRIPFYYKKREEARSVNDNLAYMFFNGRMISCILAAYAFWVTVLSASSVTFSKWWPALCGFWTRSGELGGYDHQTAITGDCFIALVASVLLYWATTSVGSIKVRNGSTETFKPADRHVLASLLAPLQAELATLDPTNPAHADRIKEINVDIQSHQSIWGSR